MHRMSTDNGTWLRVFAAVAVALLLALPIAQATRALPSDGDTDIDWQSRADGDVQICDAEGGQSHMHYYTNEEGDISGAVVECLFPPFVKNRHDWTCVESPYDSACANNSGPAPTYSPFGPRAPGDPVANPGLTTGGQPTPTPLPPSLLTALQHRTTAEMAQCTAHGGTPTRIDTTAGDDLHATTVQCAGGGLNGTICVNTGTGATCQPGNGQSSRQPVLQIRNPGGAAATPMTVATQATLSLVPAGTPGAGSSSTPVANTGNRTVIGGIAVKPGPAKLPPEVTNSAVYANAWTCPPTINRSDDVNQLRQVCQELHDTDMALTGTGVAPVEVHGDIAVTGLPAGQYTIYELLPTGSSAGALYCNLVPTGAPPPTVWTLAFDHNTTDYGFSLADNQTIYCNWFSSLPAGSGTINGRNSGLKPEVTTVATPRS